MQATMNPMRYAHQAPMQFQAKEKGLRFAAVLPPADVKVHSDFVDIGHSNHVRTVTIEGKKFLLVDGIHANTLIPFVSNKPSSAHITQDNDWVCVGNTNYIKTIVVDDETFAIVDGVKAVTGQNLDAVSQTIVVDSPKFATGDDTEAVTGQNADVVSQKAEAE